MLDDHFFVVGLIITNVERFTLIEPCHIGIWHKLSQSFFSRLLGRGFFSHSVTFYYVQCMPRAEFKPYLGEAAARSSVRKKAALIDAERNQ